MKATMTVLACEKCGHQLLVERRVTDEFRTEIGAVWCGNSFCALNNQYFVPPTVELKSLSYEVLRQKRKHKIEETIEEIETRRHLAEAVLDLYFLQFRHWPPTAEDKSIPWVTSVVVPLLPLLEQCQLLRRKRPY
jgi:hypothetical protein